MLVDHHRGRDQTCQLGNQIDEPWVKTFECQIPPSLIIPPPSSGHLVGFHRRNKACENRSCGVARRDSFDDRQDARHPWRVPGCRFGKEVLHINAKMEGAIGQGTERESSGDRHSDITPATGGFVPLGLARMRFTSAATSRWTTWPGCSTATSGVGSTTTAGTTNRLSTRPCDTTPLFWLDRRIGSSSPCDAIGDKQRTGSLALRGDNRRCSPTGGFCRGAAGQWEPDEARVSRPVLRARGGEIPPRDSPCDPMPEGQR